MKSPRILFFATLVSWVLNYSGCGQTVLIQFLCLEILIGLFITLFLVYSYWSLGLDYPSAQHPTMKPNSIQIANIQKRQRSKQRLSHDALHNLHELAYDLDNFVLIIKTFPDLIVICGLKKMVKELNDVLHAKSHLPQLLSYDTTFQLGDFYVSPLLFRHTLFSSSPVIPVLFLVHERKFQLVHDQFMKQLARLVPSLVAGKWKVPLVTDDEAGICKAIDEYLSNVTRVRCWNHTIIAIKHWLRNHGASTLEIPVYISNVRELLNQSTEETYLEKLKLYQAKWSKAFDNYYMDKIHPEISTTLGRFVLEPMHLYHPFSGITNNQSEIFNATLKRLQRWREVPVDSIVLTLYHLQAFYCNEIQRGLAGLGNYRLQSCFRQCSRSIDELVFITCYSPYEVVDKLQQRKLGDGNISIPLKEVSQSDTVKAETAQTEDDSISSSTTYSRARSIIEKQQICHNQSLGVFTVLGTTGKPYAIRLFPEESCTCPSTNQCYHIMAVRMSIGLHNTNSKKKINLTQLCRKRAGDYEVVPTPDTRHSRDLEGESCCIDISIQGEEFTQVTDNSELGNLPAKLDGNVEGESNCMAVTVQGKETQVSKESHIPTKSEGKTPTDVENSQACPLQIRKKRKRCETCEGCTSTDCGECRYCFDKPKFGSEGKRKQCCIQRRWKRIRLDSRGNTGDLVSIINSCQVYRHDLQTLHSDHWLNDKIIDAYIALVMEEVNRSSNLVYCVSCEFFQQLNRCNNYDVMSRWIKVNLASYNKFIVPVNMGYHWSLIIADFTTKELKYYDSMLGEPKNSLEKIRDFLIKSHPGITSWKMLCPKDIPQQSNTNDCGVFTCMYARYQALDLPFSFCQKDIPCIRKRMISELTKQKLQESS